jgi:endonuclease/exonuclease/phosphatase family metal-dependent hydrolase
MRVMTWNCHGLLGRKQELLQRVAPHIAVVQECSLEDSRSLNRGPQFFWQSKQINPANRGLGIISFNPKLMVRPLPLPEQWSSLMESDPGRMDVIIPVEVLAPVRINMLAVWSYNNRHRRSEMHKLRGPVLCALDFLGDWLSKAPSLVIGDFNNHPSFDKSRTGKNLFSEHVNTLEKLGMKSLYHESRREAHGAELTNSHFWTGRKHFHIDYIFASEQARKASKFTIMSFQEMKALGVESDHVPLWADFPDAMSRNE